MLKEQQSRILDLNESLSNNRGPHKVRLVVQLIDGRHDSASGSFPLVEEVYDEHNELALNDAPSTYLFKSLQLFASKILSQIREDVSQEANDIVQSDKELKRSLIESQINALKTELDNL